MKYNIRKLVIVVVILISFSAFATETIDRIVAVVNNEVITLSELKMASKEMKSNNLENVLNRLIDNTLLDQKIAESKMLLSDDELAMAVKRILIQGGMTIDQLHAEVRKQGMSYEEYTKQLRSELIRSKFVNQVVASQIKVDERDIRDYYTQHRDIYKGEFEKERDAVYEAVFNEKLPSAMSIYLAKIKKESFISIKDDALVSNNR